MERRSCSARIAARRCAGAVSRRRGIVPDAHRPRSYSRVGGYAVAAARRGGIGRRAGFRSRWASALRGSSPLARIAPCGARLPAGGARPRGAASSRCRHAALRGRAHALSPAASTGSGTPGTRSVTGGTRCSSRLGSRSLAFGSPVAWPSGSGRRTARLSHTDGRLALRGFEQLWGAPVGGEASAVGGEEDDVDRAARWPGVLLILVLVAGSFTLATISVGARPSFSASFGPPAATSRGERFRSEDTEAPGLRSDGGSAPSAPAPGVLDGRAIERLGLVGLVRSPCPDWLRVHLSFAT